MRTIRPALLLLLSSPLASCVSDSDPGSGPGGANGKPGKADDPAGDTEGEVEIAFVFVHGVQSKPEKRRTAHQGFADLEAEIVERLERRSHEMADRSLVVKTGRANLYASPDGELIEPGIDDETDGSGTATAMAWRRRLVAEIERIHGPDQRNLILVGHSTGARVAMEVAANVGADHQPGSHDWGLEERVAGVVTLHGMIDGLQSNAYDVLGPVSYVTGCKLAQGDGWCEYSGFVSGVPATDWVASNLRALVMISSASCSPAGWSGVSDKSIPLAAQGSPQAFGVEPTVGPGGVYRPAHGFRYGDFCHSDPVSRSSERHAEAVSAASDAIERWLFEAAPRVANIGPARLTVETESLPGSTWSPTYTIDGTCPPSEVDTGAPDVVGSCFHPGLFDGDDHPMDDRNEIDVSGSEECSATVRWRHLHGNDKHGGRLWFKVYTVPVGGGLLSSIR